MSSENQDYEGDLIDLHVRSPVLPRALPNFQTFIDTSDNLIDTELPILEQKLQTANQIVTPVVDSRRTSVDIEDILITIDDDEVDAPQRVSDNFLDLCDVGLIENLEALNVLRNLDDILNASLLESDDELNENGEVVQEDIENCLKDLDNYLRTLDSSSSEECSYSSNDSSSSVCIEDQPSATSSSDQPGNQGEADVLGSADEERLRNKLRQMEENYTKFLASGCVNRGYVDTETIEGERRPLSACGMATDALSRNQPTRATVAVVRRERPSLQAVIASSTSESPTSRPPEDRTSAPAGDSDEDIDWSWVQDVARDVTLERRAHAAGDCCTGTVVVEPPRPARPSSSSEPAMHEEPKVDARGTWLRSSMRRLQHLRLPSDEAGEPQVEPLRPEQVQMQTATAMRPVSAPSRLPASAVRVSTRSSRSRSRESAVSHEPSGRARSSSASSRSRRPRSLSSSESSLASSVDSTPSCSPAASPTQNAQEQQNATASSRRMPGLPEPVKVSPLIKFLRYSFLIAGIIYGASKLKALRIIEEGRKEEKERRRHEREMRIAEEKKAASERDIAQIVAIFTGKPEADSKVADQSYLAEPAKLDTEEVKHTIKDENNFSDDLSTCTVEEVKQMVQVDKTGPSPTVNTEYGSTDPDESNVSTSEQNSAYKPESDSGDIFSDVFNLTQATDRKTDILDIKARSKIISDSSDPGTNEKVTENASKQDGYYVESFAGRLPYAEPDAFKDDFFGKDDK